MFSRVSQEVMCCEELTELNGIGVGSGIKTTHKYLQQMAEVKCFLK